MVSAVCVSVVKWNERNAIVKSVCMCVCARARVRA
jgi:hypothetical protein